MHQTYLIIGAPEPARSETISIFKSLKSKFTTNSPDITIIAPEKKVITIDQVRQVKSQISQKPLTLPYKFVIFQNAEALNTQAQNAVLKILEEPPSTAIIILEAADKTVFLETILSRVAKIWAKAPKSESLSSTSLVDIEDAELIGEIGQIDNPEKWLDDQMLLLFEKLKNGSVDDFQKTITALSVCADAKKLITANVNPKFVLANLFLSATI